MDGYKDKINHHYHLDVMPLVFGSQDSVFFDNTEYFEYSVSHYQRRGLGADQAQVRIRYLYFL